MGVGATVFTDVWNLLLKRIFRIPSLNYCLLGRWVGHMPRGTFRHRAIANAPAIQFECALGWLTHYTIGVALAIGFVLLAPNWLRAPQLAPALLYGIATVVLPFFVMQPALGLGIASAATRRPAQARLKSLATHTVYGIGLYTWGVAAASCFGMQT